MYAPTGGHVSHQRRRKKRNTQGLRTVEVARGRSGYGFTISGQSPCILSCIVGGSPADRAGLKTGDFLISVAGQCVSRSSHDDVVRLIGSSRGVLTLQIAENFNHSSESSDDEAAQVRPKSKYPNRTRTRGDGGRSVERPTTAHEPPTSSYPKDRYKGEEPSHKYAQNRVHSQRDVYQERGAPRTRLRHHNSSPCAVRGVENVNPLMPDVPPRLPSHYDRHVTSRDGIIRYRSPSRTKHTIITREARLGVNGGDHTEPAHVEPMKRRPPTVLRHAELTTNLDVVIGYAGSIDMPRHSKMQTVRGAVRRLRVEKRIHTLVLMEIGVEGVKLVNNLCCTVACYGPQRVAFAGLCPDDNRFFGLVTLGQDGGPRNDGGASCHVFMVDPNLCPHEVHEDHAHEFGVTCQPDPSNPGQCLQFPGCAMPVVHSVSVLMRAPHSAHYQAEMLQMGVFVPLDMARRTSDSREGVISHEGVISREAVISREDKRSQNARACVVDLHENRTQADQPCNVSQSSGSSSFISSDDGPAGVCDLSPIPTTLDRLNVRARPDPVGFKSPVDEGLEQQSSADNLRRSLHLMMRQPSDPKPAPDLKVTLDPSTSSPTENLPPPLPPRQSSPRPPSSSQYSSDPLAVSVPVAPSFPPPPLPSYTPNSHNKPPIPERRPAPRRTPRPSSRPCRTSSVPERSKSTPPFRLGDEMGMVDEDYDSDPGAVCTESETIQKGGQESASEQSDSPTKSVAVSGAALPSQDGVRCVSAVTSHGVLTTQANEDTSGGRAASWAVNFHKLLQDKAGLATFTVFLKKEYSEENIVFWAQCEKYRCCEDLTERQTLAKEIFSSHLSDNASDPINVDSQVRRDVEQNLSTAPPDLYDNAQKHIWMLMKQDSYTRFLRSELYKQCVMADMEGMSLPYTGEDSPVKPSNTLTSKKSMKKVRTASGTEEGGEEKRRKSLLPWNRNKSDKKMNKAVTESSLPKSTASSNGSVVSDATEASNPVSGEGVEVTLPDLTHLVAAPSAGQSARDLLSALCDLKGLHLNLLEVVDKDHHDQVIDLSSPSLSLPPVALLHCSLLRLELPAHKAPGSVLLRAGPGRTLKDVLWPVLTKFGLTPDNNLVLHVSGTGVVLDESSSASEFHLKHIVAQCLDDFRGKKKKEWGNQGSTRSHGNSARPPLPRSFSSQPASPDPMAALLRDLGEGVTIDSMTFDDLGIMDIEKKSRGEDTRNSGLFSFIRRNSVGERDERGNKPKSKSKTLFSYSSKSTSSISQSTKEANSDVAQTIQSSTHLPAVGTHQRTASTHQPGPSTHQAARSISSSSIESGGLESGTKSTTSNSTKSTPSNRAGLSNSTKSTPNSTKVGLSKSTKSTPSNHTKVSVSGSTKSTPSNSTKASLGNTKSTPSNSTKAGISNSTKSTPSNSTKVNSTKSTPSKGTRPGLSKSTPSKSTKSSVSSFKGSDTGDGNLVGGGTGQVSGGTGQVGSGTGQIGGGTGQVVGGGPGGRRSRRGQGTDEDRFLDLLSRTSRQMDDQRGLTRSQLELPDFLKLDSPSKLQRKDFSTSESSIFVTDRAQSKSAETLDAHQPWSGLRDEPHVVYSPHRSQSEGDVLRPQPRPPRPSPRSTPRHTPQSSPPSTPRHTPQSSLASDEGRDITLIPPSSSDESELPSRAPAPTIPPVPRARRTKPKPVTDTDTDSSMCSSEARQSTPSPTTHSLIVDSPPEIHSPVTPLYPDTSHLHLSFV